MNTSTLSIEVITLPVSDVDRAVAFYVDQVGFSLDVDYKPNDAFRVVQLTPLGSACSIQIGIPRRNPKFLVMGCVFGPFEHGSRDIVFREVGHWVMSRFEQENDVFAIGDPRTAEAHSHASTQRLGVQQSLGKGFGREKTSDCSC